MGTKLTELRDGCFHAAMDDEPMFVLLARDPDAPRIVRNWASQREDDVDHGRRPASDRAKIAEARATADKMERWRKDNDGAWRDGLFADRPKSDIENTPTAERARQLMSGEGFAQNFKIERQTDLSQPIKAFYDEADMQHHHVRKESDEYACSCGKRWAVDEGDEHP